MKQFIIILSIFFTTQLVAQTNLDTILFNKVNDYRVSNGLDKIVWDNDIYKVANHHSAYLKLLNYDSLKTIVSHLEEVDIKGFDELNLYDRFKKYSHSNKTYVAENISGGLIKRNFSNEWLVDSILNLWKNSKEHNANMLNPNIKQGACKVIIFIKPFYSSTKNYSKPIEIPKMIAILDVSN